MMNELRGLDKNFSMVCISGDTDCFLDPDAGSKLINEIALAFTSVDIMFTSRLVPSKSVVSLIIDVGINMAKRKRLLIPCISVVSDSFPNRVENPNLVPPTEARLDLLRQFHDGGLPCFLTIRPTFPFEVVSRTEVARLIAKAAAGTTAVLGEAFILDMHDEISSRLGMSSILPEPMLSPLSFIPQPTLWKKALFQREIDFTRSVCESYGLPFFLRSMSAVSYMKKYWDFEHRESTFSPGDLLDSTLDSFLP